MRVLRPAPVTGIKSAVLLESVLAVNDQQPLNIINKTEAAIGKIAKKHVGVLGLSFKAIHDMESSSLN